MPIGLLSSIASRFTKYRAEAQMREDGRRSLTMLTQNSGCWGPYNHQLIIS
jgi:hypothetical protein